MYLAEIQQVRDWLGRPIRLSSQLSDTCKTGLAHHTYKKEKFYTMRWGEKTNIPQILVFNTLSNSYGYLWHQSSLPCWQSTTYSVVFLSLVSGWSHLTIMCWWSLMSNQHNNGTHQDQIFDNPSAADSCGTSYAGAVSIPLQWILKNVL